MMDRGGFALGAVAGESFAHRHTRIAFHDRLANGLTFALANEPDWLAVRRPLFSVRLTVAGLVGRAGDRFACLGIIRARTDRLITAIGRSRCGGLADAGRAGGLPAGTNLIRHGDPFSCSSCFDHGAG
jgi:hypothetical protein